MMVQRTEKHHIMERIFDLALEVICLLAGESFPAVKKSGDHMTITVPPTHSLTPEKHKKRKILEATKKMMELLTGEVPIRCQDVTVYFSMEEWEYLEGHKDLYKDVMMDNQLPFKSPDGSSNRIPPARCPRPLFSRYSTQEDHNYAHHYQGKDLIDLKVEVKVEDGETYLRDQSIKVGEMMAPFKEKESFQVFIKNHLALTSPDGSSHGNPPERCPRPLYSRDSTQEGHTIPHHHQVDGSSHGNPLERCPRPLYFRDSTQEDHNYAQHYQCEDLLNVTKAKEGKKTRVRGDQKSREKAAIVEEESSLHITKDGSSNRNPPERCPPYSRDSTPKAHGILNPEQIEKLIRMKIKLKREEEKKESSPYIVPGARSCLLLQRSTFIPQYNVMFPTNEVEILYTM